MSFTFEAIEFMQLLIAVFVGAVIKTFKPLFYYNEVYLDNCNIILGSQEITNNQQKVLLWAPVEFPANKLILREMGQRLSFIPKQFKNY